MIGQFVSQGIGSPSSVSLFILVGLSANPEVRDAETLNLVGFYAPLSLVGEYVPTQELVGAYVPTWDLTGEI